MTTGPTTGPANDPAPTSDGSRATGSTAVRVLGATISAAGLVSWLGWLSWRVSHLTSSIIGLAILVLEFVAFAAALVVTAGLWVGRPAWRRDRRRTDFGRQLPLLLADALELGEMVDEASVQSGLGSDDTGEIAWARRGIRNLGAQRHSKLRSERRQQSVREAAWSVVAVDGLRRLISVVVLVGALFSGSSPFGRPPTASLVMLVAGIVTLSIGHWVLSSGFVRPGSRLVWSMASIGAGLGDGVSRSGLPIRWVVTMATVVALNISVALRGMSDRWTHGLRPMQHDARVVSMSLALALVAVGGFALRKMPRPELGFYGATRRLEEDSVRRLALGLTLVVAAIGFVAGAMPVEQVLSAP